MRHFTLVNSSGDSLDITTTEILFHDISGLGFDEDNDFRQIGDFWMLNRTGRNQSTISGNIIFNETEGDRKDPYEKYWFFSQFIRKAPLTMLYNPYGDGLDEHTYRRTVRVSKLEKSEKTENGVLDSSIEFVCYTPWYNIITASLVSEESETDDGGAWIFAGTATEPDPENEGQEIEVTYPPLVFEPEGQEAIENVRPAVEPYSGDCQRTKFRHEPLTYLSATVEAVTDCPVKLTIYGPIRKPSWTHRVVKRDGNEVTSEVVGSGAFTGNLVLESTDVLIIDGTSGKYSMEVHRNGVVIDVYSQRNFSLPCFLSLQEGENRISVASGDGDFVTRIELEGHMYYATV